MLKPGDFNHFGIAYLPGANNNLLKSERLEK